MRELERKLPEGRHAEKLALYHRVLTQQRGDKDKIYSLHEPHVKCFGKGKAHKKYDRVAPKCFPFHRGAQTAEPQELQFGNKVALIVGAKSGVITAAESFEENLYDARTLPAVLEQAKANTGVRPATVLADRGFRGPRQIGGTEIIMPQAEPWPADKAERKRRRHQNIRRVSIEPRIGHLKTDFRLGRNFLRGALGDSLNLLLASNFRKWMRRFSLFVATLQRLLRSIFLPSPTPIAA